MRNSRKIISIILAAIMLISIIPADSLLSRADERVDEAIEITSEEKAAEPSSEEVSEDTSKEEVTEVTTEAKTEPTQAVVTEPVNEVTNENPSEITPEASSEATTEVTTENTSEDKSEDKSEADKKAKDSEKKSKDADKKDDKKEDKKKDKEDKEEEIIPTFDKIYDGVNVSGIDFSSCELLIATSDSSIFTSDTDVVSEYKGVYLTRYKNAEQTKSAYTYYFNKCQFIDVNNKIKANSIGRETRTPSFKKTATATDADDDSDGDSDKEKKEVANDGHGEADLSDLNEGSDALSNISGKYIGNYAGYIALIDTGATNPNVIRSVSVLGDGAEDDNGHGTELAKVIAQANPDAKILSIKALGADGTGKVSDVYAAIEYAISANVSIINLSMCSTVSAESESLEKAISQAKAKGIKVVASAGNNGKPAAYYTPANITGVLTIGAADSEGNRISSSNYGSCVDYYVTAGSTSTAAAKFSAYLLSDGLDKVSERDDVFTNEEAETSHEEEIEEASLSDAEEDIELRANVIANWSKQWESYYNSIYGKELTNAPRTVTRSVQLSPAGSTSIVNLQVSMKNDIAKESGTGSLKNWNYLDNIGFTDAEWGANGDKNSRAGVYRNRILTAIDKGAFYDLPGTGGWDLGTPCRRGAYAWSCIQHDNANPIPDAKYHPHAFLKIAEDAYDMGQTRISTAWYATIYESTAGKQCVAIAFGIQKVETMPKSYIPIKKIMLNSDGSVAADYTNNNVPEIWFAVYSDSNYKKLIGYMHTSATSGNGACYTLRDASGNALNEYTLSGETGYIPESEGSTVYIKELGVPNNASGKSTDNVLPTSFKDAVIGGVTFIGKNKKLGGFETVEAKPGDVDSYPNSYASAYNESTTESRYIAVYKVDEQNGIQITDPNALFQFVGYDPDTGKAIRIPMQYISPSGGTPYECGYRNYKPTLEPGTIREEHVFVDKEHNTGNFDFVYNYENNGTISHTNHGYSNNVFYSDVGYWYAQGYTNWYAYEVQVPANYKPNTVTYHAEGVPVEHCIGYYANEGIELDVHPGSYPFTVNTSVANAVPNTPKDRKVTVLKKDPNNRTISGIHFSIKSITKVGSTTAELPQPDKWDGYTDANGKLTFTYKEVPVGGIWNIELIEDGYEQGNVLAEKVYNFVKYDANGNADYPNHNKTLNVTLSAIQDNADEFYVTGENPSPLPVSVVKSLSDTTCSDNPNYSLEGIKINLYKDSRRTNLVGEMVLDKNGKVVQTKAYNQNVYINRNYLELSDMDINQLFNKDANGKLLKTKFYYDEVIPADKKDNFVEKDFGSNDYIEIDPDNHTTMNLINIVNKPKMDPLEIVIQKVSAEGDLRGNQTLEGAEFTVKFYEQDINGDFDPSGPVERTWVFATKKDTDGKYKISLKDAKDYRIAEKSDDLYYNEDGFVSIPRGFITVEESKAPVGFEKTNEIQATTIDDGSLVSVNNGVLVLKSTAEGFVSQDNKAVDLEILVTEEDSIRADIDFLKVDEDDNPMPNIPFLLSNVTLDENGKVIKVNESVTVYTDDQGYFSTASSYVPHSTNTNAGKPKNGTWMPVNDITNLSDNKGALYVGDYTLRELRSSANRGKQLEKEIIFHINNEDKNMVKRVLDITAADAHNKIWNMKNPTLKTEAEIAETDSRMLAQKGVQIDYTNQTLVDTVSYTGLREETDYTLKTELMVVTKDKDGKVTNVTPYLKEGKPYVATKTFSVPGNHDHSYVEKSGEVEVTCTGIDPTGLEQKYIVVYETLYLGTYDSPEALEEAIKNDTMNYTYPEFTDEDEMDIFPVEHHEPTDDFQTVKPVDIHTNATDGVSMDHVALPQKQTVIKDIVSYSGLHIGKEYTVTGTLHVKKDSAWEYKNGEIKTNIPTDEHELKDAAGNPITASHTFTAEKESGFIELEFTVDSSLLEGRTTVAFETLESNGIELAVHKDITDEDETIHFPQFRTTSWSMTAPKNDDGSLKYDDELTKEVAASSTGGDFVDTIHYHNLLANRTYMVVGTLMNKVTGEPIKDATGKVITATGYFKTPTVAAKDVTESPDAPDMTLADGTTLDMSSDHADYLADGNYDLEFKGYDLSSLGNTTGVVFEEIYLVENEKSEDKSKKIGEHKDIDDVDQFLYFVDVHTNANDKTTGIKVVPQDTDTVIEDRITYKNLIPGKKYTVTGTLHVKNDFSGKYKDRDELLGADGKPVTKTVEFVPDKPDGEVIVEIPLNTSNLRHMEIVVFEGLYNEYGMLVGLHAEIDDELQTVEIPEGKTKAFGKDTGEQIVGANETVTIVDTMFYENLEPGKEYTLSGTLMDKETGTPLTVNGAAVTNTITFTPTTKSGSVNIEFTFNASALKGKTIVAFEDILYKDKTVIIHHDINDHDETVKIPSGHTTAIGKDTEDHVVQVGDKVTIIDTVYYEGLIPGKEYEIEGTLYSKKTKSPIKSGDNPVTSTKKFIPEAETGTVDVEFTISTEALQGSTLVVFEDVYYTNPAIGVKANVFSHHDIDDEDETVYIPKIGTKATVNGKHNVVVGGKIKINDEVKYKNLVPDKTYVLEGVLMDKKTGKEVKVNGKPVTAKTKFTPEEANGTANVVFEFDASGLSGDLVVYETLYHADVEIASHKDIDDESQTVTLTNPNIKLTPPKTGMIVFFIIIGMMAAGGAGMLVFRKKKIVIK